MQPPPSTYTRVYAAVARIPAGRVATYGQVAALVGAPRGARQVGYALAALPAGSAVPWHRVVNARGEISVGGASAVTQRLRLVRERVLAEGAARVDLAKFGWRARGARPEPRGRRSD